MAITPTNATPSRTPRVSVVMSVYNGLPYLHEAVESILAQTFTDFEFVIIDDGSTDGSGEVLDEYAAHDERVRVLHQENRGLITSLNRGLEEARGTYIARMDADDISHSERFEKQIEAFKEIDDVVMVSSAFEFMTEAGASRSITDRSEDADLVEWFLLFYNYVGGHSQVMFRRDAAIQAGRYNPQDLHVEDYGLWYRLLQRGRFVCLPDVLLRYRFHAESVSRQNASEQTHHLQQMAQQHLEDAVGLALSIEEVQHVQALWLGKRSSAYPDFPSQRAVGQVERCLQEVYNSFMRAAPGQQLSASSRAKLCRRVGERYLAWARTLPFWKGPTDILKLVRLALRWDSALAPLAARVLVGRAAAPARLLVESRLKTAAGRKGDTTSVQT